MYNPKSAKSLGLWSPPHPTPPRRFRKSNGRSRLSNGRSRISHGLAAAPGHGQVALGAKKVARTWTGARNEGPAPLPSPPAQLGLMQRTFQFSIREAETTVYILVTHMLTC